MSFVVQSSTLPGAVGAGDAAGAVPLDAYAFRLTFESEDEEAEMLATFGDGPELQAAKAWAQNAYGLTLMAIEPFDGPAAAKKAKAAAARAAAPDNPAEAKAEAKQLVHDAREEAKQLVQGAKAEVEDLIRGAREESALILQEARDQAGEIEEEAKTKAAEILDKATAEAAELQKPGGKGGK